MDWEAIGAIGQLISAAAVVLSLVYLGVQIRQNTKAVRSSTRFAWMEAIQRQNALEAQHISVFLRAAAPQPLDGQDELLLASILFSLLNAVEALHVEWLEGNVDEAYWNARLNTALEYLAVPRMRAEFDRYKSQLDVRLVERLETELGKGSVSTEAKPAAGR
jgi:hypothetical protein